MVTQMVSAEQSGLQKNVREVYLCFRKKISGDEELRRERPRAFFCKGRGVRIEVDVL